MSYVPKNPKCAILTWESGALIVGRSNRCWAHFDGDKLYFTPICPIDQIPPGFIPKKCKNVKIGLKIWCWHGLCPGFFCQTVVYLGRFCVDHIEIGCLPMPTMQNIPKSLICGHAVDKTEFWGLLGKLKKWTPPPSAFTPYLRTGEGVLAFWESLGSLGGRRVFILRMCCPVSVYHGTIRKMNRKFGYFWRPFFDFWTSGNTERGRILKNPEKVQERVGSSPSSPNFNFLGRKLWERAIGEKKSRDQL